MISENWRKPWILKLSKVSFIFVKLELTDGIIEVWQGWIVRINYDDQ